MDDKSFLISPSSFLRYASDNLDLWRLLIGQHIEHILLGPGKIVDIYKNENGIRIRNKGAFSSKDNPELSF